MSHPSLAEFSRLGQSERGLSFLATLRADGSVQASVVNVGVLEHPLSGRDALGLVAVGRSHKLANLRANPRATVVVRVGWEWLAVEGEAVLIGPDDPAPELDDEGVRQLLRRIFAAAGGTHDNWEDYDATMARERRAAIIITPDRIYSNPSPRAATETPRGART
jgi:PPOX class probable F420-dependent enzyme